MKGEISKTQKEERLEVTSAEGTSLLRFLNGKAMKTVELRQLIGIGGEGIVIRDIREREVAIKFVKFEMENGEDLGTEAGYFGRLRKLGDYKVATNSEGGYTRPYLDFGISKIFHNFYYAIGEQRLVEIK